MEEDEVLPVTNEIAAVDFELLIQYAQHRFSDERSHAADIDN